MAPTLINLRTQFVSFLARHGLMLVALLLFLGGLALYISTLAPGLVFGDPAEYTVVPHQWGILHPPGYAFMTLLVKTWQTLVPLGSVAWRTNLLSAVAGAAIGLAVFGAVWQAVPKTFGEARWVGALVAAIAILTAPNVWQHSIHTNAHIITAGLAALSLWLLLRWRTQRQFSPEHPNRYLWVFCVVAGMSVTQHPLLVFGFPAYTAFILITDPQILRQPRTLLTMVLLGVAGLASWLYFPIRTAIGAPPFGPDNLHTWEGFSSLVLAQGLRVNLFAYGLGEQGQRIIVFASLIQLQYALPLLAFAIGGLVWLARRAGAVAVLLGVHAGVNLLFTLNTVQDVMAYLLVPLISLAVLIGVGVAALGHWLIDWIGGHLLPRDVLIAYALVLLVFPGLQIIGLYDDISLRDETAASDYLQAVVEHFGGRAEGAVLLTDWEHMTPYWYWRDVAQRPIDPADVTPTLVIGTSPTLWIDTIWANIEVGPIYLVEYRPDVINTGFRLQAEGPFYRVVPPPAEVARPIASPLTLTAGPIEWLGFDLQVDGPVAPGTQIPLVLYFRAPAGTEAIIHPYGQLGNWRMDWTTDSRWLTPYWQPGEVIAERWTVYVPLTAEPGRYPLQVALRDLTAGGALLPLNTGEAFHMLGEIEVAGAPLAAPRLLNGLAANFGNQVGVAAVTAQANGWQASAPWPTALPVQAGQTIHVQIHWRALAQPQDSLTVFVHLNNLANQVITSRDYTPLGGAFPTHLWFPKWLPSQQVIDPYQILVPPDLPPGEYYLEIGLYGLRSIQRVSNIDAEGNLAGDRFVLGSITVLP